MKANFNMAKNVRNSRSISALSTLRKLQSIGLLLCALLFGSSQVWGESASITFADEGLENGVQYTDPFELDDNVTITFAGGSNDGKYYTTGSGIRTYGDGTITVATTSGKITAATFTFASGYAPGDNVADVGTWTSSNSSWSGNASSFTLTRPSGSGNWRLQSVSVTYTPAASGYTVDFAVNPAGYGTVSPSAQLTGIASGTAITKSSNTVTIGETTVTATPHASDATYNYAFNNWTVTDNLTSVTKNVTVTANFTRSARSFSNYRTLCSTTDPTLTATPNSVSGLDYIVGTGPSAAGSFSISGSNLESGTLTISAPTNFEVSLDNSSWGSSKTKSAGGTLSATTVYVRLATGKSAGEYSGNVSISGCGLASAVNVAVSGTVYTPTIIATPASVSWNTSVGVAPTTQSVTITGTHLKGDISAALGGTDAGSFSISTSSIDKATAEGAGGTIIITYTGSYAATTTKTATLTLSSSSAENVVVNITFNVIVDPNRYVLTPFGEIGPKDKVIIVGDNGTKYAMSNNNGTTNPPSAIDVTDYIIEAGAALSIADASTMLWNIVKAGDGSFQIKKQSDNEVWLYCISNNNGLRVGTSAGNDFTIVSDGVADGYIHNTYQERLAGIYNSSDWRSYGYTPGTSASVPGNISGQTFSFYVQKSTDPFVTLTSSFSEFTYEYNHGPSASQSFTVSGTNLQGNITITPPSNYAISTDNSSFSTSPITLSPTDGTVASTTLYIRLVAGLAVGTYNVEQASGLSVTSTNADAVKVAVSGSVTPESFTVTATSSNVSHGTVSPASEITTTNMTITASPVDGYRVVSGAGGYTVTAGTASVTNNGDNTFTVTPSTDCTVRINFEAIPTHKVTYWASGVKVQESDVLEGAAIPDQTTKTWSQLADYCATRTACVGWCTNPDYSSDDTAPTGMITTQSPGGTMSASDVNYYAVFANVGGTSNTFSRVTALSQLADGDVIAIVAEQSGGQIFGTGADHKGGAAPSETDSKITVSAATNKWTLEASSTSWKLLKDDDNKLCADLGYTAYGNTFNIVDANTANYFFIKSSSKALEYYSSNWQFYTISDPANATQNGNVRLKLYKNDPGYIQYATNCACPGYSMHFGTRGESDWSDKDSYCFVASEDADGNSGVYWYLEDFELPAKPHFYVGWEGLWNTTDAKSADADFSDLCFGLVRDNQFSCSYKTLGTYSSGNNQGAIGTLRVRSSYTDDNKYIDFIPGGYVLRLSDDNGSTYASTALVPASASLTETVWTTDGITTISADLATNGKFFVDLKKSSDHVWAPNMSEVANISSMGYKKDGGSSAGSWGTGLSAGMRGKFRIWADNCSKNWNAHFVPYYHLSYDGNGDGVTNLPEASDDKSCEGNDAARTVVVSSTIPTRDGYTFLGWAESTAHATAGTVDYTAGNNIILTADKTIYAVWAQNFTVTYDLGGGTASPECAGGTYYVDETVDVCTSTPTRASSSFLGWLVYKTGDKSTTVTVAAGQFTMPAYNVTVEAQWETVYYHIYYKEEDGTAIATDDVPQTMETTLRNQSPCPGYSFYGWSTSKITTETTTKPTGVTFIGKGGASYTPTSDITVYPVYARSEGATTVKDTLTVANTGVTTSYTPLTGIDKNNTPKTIHSDAVYAIGAYKSNGMQFTDGTSNEDQKKSSLITTTSGGSLQSIRARIPYDCSTTRYLYTNGNTSDYIMQQRSSQGGTLAWTVTHSTKANTWYSHDFSEDGYTSFFMYCGGGATKVDSIIVTWETGTYYYATHCEIKENVTITYNGNGGTVGCGSPASGTVTTVTWDYADGGMGAPTLAESQTICNSATRAGYILNKWNTAADGTGRDYAKGATVTRFGGDSTLYAIWDRIYTVTLYDNGVERETLVETSAGAGVTLPSGNNCGVGSAFAFEGWTESAVELNADPVRPATLHVAGAFAPTSDITLYSVYSKSVAGCEDFAEGVSGAYKMYNNTTNDYAKVTANANRYDKGNSGDAEIFYIAYAPAHSAYSIRTSLGYLGWSGAVGSETLTKNNATPYYWKITTNGTNWNFQPVGVSGKQFSGNGTYFNLHSNSTKYYIRLEKVAMTYYYNTAICEGAQITFHDGGGTISGTPTTPTDASWNSSTHVLSGLEDCDKITEFPTANYDGWTFIGWSTEDYSNSGKHTTDHPKENASTDEPDGSEIYKTGGNPYVVRGGSVDLYPVFTRFPENEPFNTETGGDYYIYYLKPGTDDGYGANIRVYAGEYDGEKRYSQTTSCAAATTFTFTKSGDVWHIQNKANSKYIGGKLNEDWLVENASLGTLTDWTIAIKSGNQFYASCQGGGRYITFSTSANYFMDYSTTANPGICLPVYLGSCTERIYSSEPNPTPTIDLTGEPKVTSSVGGRVRATATMTLSGSHLTSVPANKVKVSGTNLKFAKTATENPADYIMVEVDGSGNASATIYVYYTPVATEDGIDNIIVTAQAFNGSSSKDLKTTSTVRARHLPADFVIAAKWGDKWYALPNTCAGEGSNTAGVQIEVDNNDVPTVATAAPSTAKWGMRQTKAGSRSDGSYNDRLVFTERTTAEANNQKTLYNYNKAEVFTSATYTNYNNTNPERYEWIPVTTDFGDYELTNANNADHHLILRNSDGLFVAQNSDKSYDGKVRLLPATFYEEAPVQIVEWKENSVVVMYTGTETSATTKVGTNSASSAQTLSTHKLTHGIYELTTGQSLASNDGKTLLLTFGSMKKAFEIPVIVTGNSTAYSGHEKQDVVIVNGGKLSAAATKYSYRNIYVYGGGKLKIASGTDLGVNNIILRAGGISTSGIGSTPSATYEYVYPQVELRGTLSSTKTNIHYEYITDYDHWYHLVLPFDGTLSSITYPTEYYGDNVAGNKGSWVIKRYAGEVRATGNYNAWVDIENESATSVTAGHGYIYWGAPKKVTIDGDKQRQQWGIQRITMPITAAAAMEAENADKTITGLSSYSEVAGNSGKVNDQGWNLIGNPYLTNLTGLNSESLITGKLVEELDPVTEKWTGRWVNNDDGVRYVTIPSEHFDTYEAQTMASFTTDNPMKTGCVFFVQIEDDATGVTFATAKRASLMPALFARTEQPIDVETGIVLSDESKKDEVNFWIKDGKTEAYEYNADYPKTMNTTNFNIYGVHSNGELSWVAISPEIAESSMAIGYQVPAAGDYMLSLSETYVSDEIEHVFVTDHGVSPEVTTDLMEEDYNFYVNQAETNDIRFTVAFKLKEEDPGTTTNVENTAGVDSDKPLKFIYNDKMYILRNGIIYDAVGKKVSEIK